MTLALSSKARQVIEEKENRPLVSIASLWEIAIKHSIGKLPLAKPFGELIPEQLQRNGFDILALTIDHMTKVSLLPFHHRDPLDRILVAQCLADSLPLVSSDKDLDAYGITRLKECHEVKD